jgi:hypothetical protein
LAPGTGELQQARRKVSEVSHPEEVAYRCGESRNLVDSYGNGTEQAQARIRPEGGRDLTHGYYRRNPAKLPSLALLASGSCARGPVGAGAREKRRDETP